MIKGKKFTQLSEGERVKIEALLNEGFTISQIATSLSRPICTISREIKRNGRWNYRSSNAQFKTIERHRLKAKRIVFDEQMRHYIYEQLRHKRWSPEIISHHGRAQRSDFVSHEWIYQWIWTMKFSVRRKNQDYRDLYKYLRHGKRRRKRGKQHCNRGNIIDRTWIEHRCQKAKDRKRQGDLEADIILGKNRKPGLLVAIDRKTRKTWIRKLINKDATYVMNKLADICSQIGYVKTVTLDNDQSFARHYQLNKMGIKTFFTHPYSSQEKGSVENRIGIIRMFFPKKTQFSEVTHQEVRQVEKLLNDRPMRMFNYKSPNEIHIS
jgi:IS30 family transposase